MDDNEKVLEHLKLTQTVINRLGNNSFLVKGWSMTIVVAAMVLIAKHDIEDANFVLALILPVLGFWILDGYFLRQERLFRQLYNEIREKCDTDFNMNVQKHKNKCSWTSAMVSGTLVVFYLVEIAFTVVVFLMIDAKPPPAP